VVQSRTVRYLEAVLHGCWVLHVDYLARSADQGHWLPEDSFELRDAGRELKYGDGRRDSSAAAAGAVGAAGAGTAAAGGEEALGLGPPGGRRRALAGARGVFAGETVKVMAMGSDVNIRLADLERLLEVGGAKVMRGEAATAWANAAAAVVPTETEQIPDSEDDGEEEEATGDSEDEAEAQRTRGGGGWSGGGSGGRGGDGGGGGGGGGGGSGGGGGGSGLTLIMEPGQGAEAVRATEAAWGARAVDFHWVVHSIVHHTALPKGDYYILQCEADSQDIFADSES